MREKYALKKDISQIEIILSGIGIILGAGIYVLIGSAAGLAGNATWLAFLFGALVAALTGLSYAELSSMFAKADAEYEYTKKAFGKFLSFITGWMVIASGIFAGAVVTVGFSGYFNSLIAYNPQIIIAIVIMILAGVMFYGVKQSTLAASVMTLIEAAGLVIIIIAGIPFLGTVDYFFSPSGFAGIFSAGALIFFAYLGFEQIVRLAEETKKAKKIIPRALIISIVITTILYVLVAISAVSIIPWQELAASSAPLSDVMKSVMGSTGFVLLSVIALFSTTNTILLELLATSRITFGMARARALPKALAKIHSKRKTPWAAIAAVAIIAIIFAVAFDMNIIAGATDFLIFITFAMVNASVIALRYKMPRARRTFTSPLSIGKFPILPALGILSSLFLLVNLELSSISVGVVIAIIGIVFYVLYKH